MKRPTIYMEASVHVDRHRYVVGRSARGAWWLLTFARETRRETGAFPLVVDARHARFFAKDGRDAIGVDGIKALARLSRKVLGPAPET